MRPAVRTPNIMPSTPYFSRTIRSGAVYAKEVHRNMGIFFFGDEEIEKCSGTTAEHRGGRINSDDQRRYHKAAEHGK